MARDDVLYRWPNLRRMLLETGLLTAVSVVALAAPPDTAGLPPNAVAPSAAANQSPAFPPLYQRNVSPEATAGIGVSMIAGVGDLNHAPGPPRAQRFRRPSLQPQCAVPPASNTLRSFAVFQWMTKQQASALGLASASDSAGDLGLPSVLVWRAGRIAECESASGKAHVIYGSEWDVGLLVEQRDGSALPATFADLRRATPPPRILAFASSTSGLGKNAALLAAFHKLASDVETPRPAGPPDRFLKDFAAVRAAGDAAIQEAGAAGPIGYIAN